MENTRLSTSLSFLSSVALSLWFGGLVVLGAVVAPIVFRTVHAPTSADAMTLVFSRFDQLKVGAAMVALLAETLRIRAADHVGRLCALRGAALLLGASLALTGATLVTPTVAGLHRGGAVRNVGPEGQKLERYHRLAEGMAKAELAALLVVFGVSAAALSCRKSSAPAL